VVKGLWPEIAVATERTLIASMNPMLKNACPSFLSKLELGSAKIGSIPIHLSGVQAHDDSQDESVIDFHLVWQGDPDIRIVAGMGPVDVEAKVSELNLSGVLRVVMGPHCEVWPCFSSASVSFVGKPILNFSLSAAKMPLDAIPGLSAWLDSFIRDNLAWAMVYPKRIAFPILDPSKFPVQSSKVDPSGTLLVHIKSCENLPESLISNIDSYVTVQLDSQPTAYKTSTVHGSSNPVYDMTFRLVVYDTKMDKLRFKLWDKPMAINVLSKIADAVTEDKPLGEIEFFVRDFANSTEEHRATTNWTGSKGKNIGSVTYTAIQASTYSEGP
jgi:Ca2+-dependent lipid-binding protein